MFLVGEIVKEANHRFQNVRKAMEGLIAKVPLDQYYTYASSSYL
jgi:hypothetical protein